MCLTDTNWNKSSLQSSLIFLIFLNCKKIKLTSSDIKRNDY